MGLTILTKLESSSGSRNRVFLWTFNGPFELRPTVSQPVMHGKIQRSKDLEDEFHVVFTPRQLLALPVYHLGMLGVFGEEGKVVVFVFFFGPPLKKWVNPITVGSTHVLLDNQVLPLHMQSLNET